MIQVLAVLSQYEIELFAAHGMVSEFSPYEFKIEKE